MWDILLTILIMWSPVMLLIWYQRSKEKADKLKGIVPKKCCKNDYGFCSYDYFDPLGSSDTDPSHPANPWFGICDSIYKRRD